MTEETKVCQFAKKADYVTLVRLCQLSHPKDVGCSCWDNPEVFAKCFVRVAYFDEQQAKKELLEQ